MKQKRWSLKKRRCFFKSGFWCRQRRGCMLNLPIKTEYWTKWSLSQFPCIVCTNQNSAAGLAQSVERSTAEREVAGSIPGAGSIHKVLPLPCKQVDLRVARMSTPNGSPLLVLSWYIHWHSEKVHFCNTVVVFWTACIGYVVRDQPCLDPYTSTLNAFLLWNVTG